jgi:protoporphyrinogen/coproporphyrinogen III oxidase
VGCTEKVVVIGAGISGMACGHRLRQLGIRCLILEGKERAGGVIATIRRNGLLFETGPQCPRFPPSVWRLVRELNIESEFIPGDPKAKRYIYRHGHLHRAPFSLTSLITTRLVGLSSKLRVLTEALRYSQPPNQEENLAEFVERKFGSDLLDNLVDPIISTVFFADSHKMGMESALPALVEWERNQGSLVRGAILARNARRKERSTHNSSSRLDPIAGRQTFRVTDALPSLGSFRSGMETLPGKLSEELKLAIRYRATIASVEPSQSENGAQKTNWRIVLSGGEKITTEHLVLAVPAYTAGQLLERSVPQLATELKAIEYAPMCTVSSVYDRSSVANALDGFGFMVPRREGLHTICTFWNSSMFSGRAPEGRVLITSFAGSAKNDHFGAMPEQHCARAVETENEGILGITGKAVDRLVWKDPQALPQYHVGHKQKVSDIYQVLRGLPNLFIIGNFLKGRSIGDCVEIAFRVAEDLHSRLRGQNSNLIAE